MAKDGTNSQKKYTIQWTGENTGYSYKLVVIPSYNDSNYASLTNSDEPYQCLSDYEYTPFEYDKYPIGLGSAPKLKLDIDLTLCSADFAKILCDPFVTFNRVTAFNTDSTFPCHETFTTGNIFEFYMDFGFGAGFQQIYVGTQITSIEEYDNQKNILSIETESIFKTITGQVRFDNFLFLHCFYTQNGSSEAVPNTSLESANFYLQRVFQEYNNTTIAVVCDYAGDYLGYFDNFTQFIEGMEYNCKVLLKKIYRKTSYDSFDIIPPEVTYYQQDNKSTGLRGASLSESDLKIVAYVGFADLATTNDFDETGANDGIVNALGEEHESVWDFLNDWYGSYLQKGGLTTSNLLSTPTVGIASIELHTPDTRDLFDTKITFFSDVSSKFTISSPESHEVENDSVEVNILGSRSSEAIEFVQPLHTVPICGNYAFVSNSFIEGASYDVYSGDERSSTRSDKALNCLLFYRTQLRDSDNNPITTGTNNNYYYLCVHHKPQITVSYDNDTSTILYSDDYNDAENGTKKQIMYAGYGVNKAAGDQLGDEWYIPEQFPISEVYGSYYVAAKTMSYFFSNPNQTKIEFSTFVNNGVVEFLGDTGLSPVIMPFFYWDIDLTDFEPQTGVFSNLPTKYEMIKCTVKKDEMAELTLLSRTE
jgi:hypothetical protein